MRIVSLEHINRPQLFVLDSFIQVILEKRLNASHAGHPNRNRMTTVVRKKFYMLFYHVTKWQNCATLPGSTTMSTPILEYPTSTRLYDTVSMDLLELSVSQHGSTYLLVYVTFFFKACASVVIRFTSYIFYLASVCSSFISYFIFPFTTPRVFLDNGTEYRNQVLETLYKQYGLKQSFTAVYCQPSKGLVVRMLSTIMGILRQVINPLHGTWEDWLPQVAASSDISLN